MERVENFLKDAETYYLATVEGYQPRVILHQSILVVIATILCR